MIDIAEKVILIALVVIAISAVATSSLKRAIIYMAIFSLLASFVYLLYRAPDVAIAEAVIGCGLAMVLYLVSIKKQRTLTVYYIHHQETSVNDTNMPQNASRLLAGLESYFEGRDLGMHIIHTVKQKNEIIGKTDYDLLISIENNRLVVYGRMNDNHVDEVEMYLKEWRRKGPGVVVIRTAENGV
ncbi:MAG: DUF4040 domain-containing protein [Clostridiales bacterium]|nr:DUF4040 domain-containing protein [Clostridiales bacterium]